MKTTQEFIMGVIGVLLVIQLFLGLMHIFSEEKKNWSATLVPTWLIILILIVYFITVLIGIYKL